MKRGAAQVILLVALNYYLVDRELRAAQFQQHSSAASSWLGNSGQTSLTLSTCAVFFVLFCATFLIEQRAPPCLLKIVADQTLVYVGVLGLLLLRRYFSC